MRSRAERARETAVGIGTVVAIGTIGLLAGCVVEERPPGSDHHGPRLLHAVGHGLFLTEDGASIEPTLADIEHTQAHLIRQLAGSPGAEAVNGPFITHSVADPIVASAIYLEELLQATRPRAWGRLDQLNKAMRNHYLFGIRGDAAPGFERAWYQGVDQETAARLASEGIELLQIIDSDMPDYKDDCTEAGVPVPDMVLDEGNGWVNRGLLDYPFLSDTDSADNEIWSWESADPPGICLALPRWEAGQSTVFGIICLGRTSNKACFFDNRNLLLGGDPFPQDGAPYSIDQFVGGVGLASNGQGECTDCHAGESPYVVHPLMSAFSDLVLTDALKTIDWYEPVVPSPFRENLGPIALPRPAEGESDCGQCHTQGSSGGATSSAGRFPNVSELFFYCQEVLTPALHAKFGPATMPLVPGDYSTQIDYLENLCAEGPGDGVYEMDPGPEDDPDFIGPPTVLPMYLCAPQIGVTRLRYGAEVQLLLDGVPIGTPQSVDNPSLAVFELPIDSITDLESSQAWTARQRFNGGPWSQGSEPVQPRDHTEVYPTGLPPPSMVTPVYDCGQSIAVYHELGATLHVFRTVGADFDAQGLASGFTAVSAPTPFSTMEEITVAQSLCADMSDPFDPPVVVEPEPFPIAAPAILDLYEDQEIIEVSALVHGATAELSSSIDGLFAASGSWPVSYRPINVVTPLGRPVSLGETITVEQALCDAMSAGTSPAAASCSSLPAVGISPPTGGDTVVYVTPPHVPGATVRIWSEDADEEIAEASTYEINVRPLVTGETLRVMHELNGGCRAPNSFVIEVR